MCGGFFCVWSILVAVAFWLAGSPSQSKPVGFASSPKVGALGSPRKLHLFAKASPFEERLPPRRGKMSRSDKRGSVDLRSKDGEGEPSRVLQGCYSDIRH